MLVTQDYRDVETPTGSMRVHIISPRVDGYPNARFPGVVVFSEIYNPTGPVLRYATSIASKGYVVAVPSVFHEFAGAEPIPYDVKGTDDGNVR